MRKKLSPILAVLMLVSLLAGCRTGGVPAPVGPNTEPTQPAVEDTTANTEPEGPVAGIPMPEDPHGTFAEYDPDREFFVLTGGVDVMKYCEGSRYSYVFQIMSRQALDAADISVWIECENEYSVEIYPHEINYRITEYEKGVGAAALPFYLYQNYRDVDFAFAAKLYELYTNPPEEGTEEAEEAKRITGGQDPLALFEQVIHTGEEDFANLQPEDIREFYLYDVLITFDVKVEEILTEMDVMVNGQLFREEIGKLHVTPELFPVSYPWPEEQYWTDQAYPGGIYFHTLYSTGIVRPFVFDAVALENLKLEEFRLLGDDFALLDILVTITANGNTVTTNWDGKSPIGIYAGDHVYIEVVTRNDLLAGLSYETVMNYELVYSHEGVKYSDYNYPTFYPNINYHEVYAIVFDGLDMESYYRDYYYPIYQEWQNEYE